MLVPVDFHFVLPDGTPLAFADVEIQLSKSAYDLQDSGVLMPSPVIVQTDLEGRVTVELWSTTTEYHVTVDDLTSDARLHYKFIVPETPIAGTHVRLQDIVVDGNQDNTQVDQSILIQVMAAKNEAVRAKLAAVDAQKAAETAAKAIGLSADEYAAAAVRALLKDSIKSAATTYSSNKIDAVIAQAMSAVKLELQGDVSGALAAFKELQDQLANDAPLSEQVLTTLGTRLSFSGDQSLTEAQKLQIYKNLGIPNLASIVGRMMPPLEDGKTGDIIWWRATGPIWAPAPTGTTVTNPTNPPAPAPSPDTSAEDEVQYNLLTQDALTAKAVLSAYLTQLGLTGNIGTDPDEVQYQALTLEATQAYATLSGYKTQLQA